MLIFDFLLFRTNVNYCYPAKTFAKNLSRLELSGICPVILMDFEVSGSLVGISPVNSSVYGENGVNRVN